MRVQSNYITLIIDNGIQYTAIRFYAQKLTTRSIPS